MMIVRSVFFLMVMGAAGLVRGATVDKMDAAMDELVRSSGVTTEPVLALPLRQAWRERPQEGFEVAEARFYVEKDGLVLLAVMSDEHIANSANEFNQKMWLLGDVLEIFIRVNDEVYYEFHVTPENQNLFLRWSPELFQAVKRKEAKFETALVEDRQYIASRTRVDATDQLWTVYAFIPYESLTKETTLEYLTVVVARYDTHPDREKAVLSATANFTRIDYHNLEAWDHFPDEAVERVRGYLKVDQSRRLFMRRPGHRR